ncbi:hypothetical protein [Cryobacterium sp. TMS1-13-1]|uniref:hypothetical protein n=1 Tax=Cryobacterium sp. TMS1-13-1 TaxID=1259220 RepID=UPI001068FFF8|nr:hypothetical protein [Cryobacterium sp. TMS1-13-1]TFD25535.1 hypothetical protein E3T31_00010 [Cryobacterium sp. TMS1-13-1]
MSPAVHLVDALGADVSRTPMGGAVIPLDEGAMRAVEHEECGERMGIRLGMSVALSLATLLLAGCASPTPPDGVEDACNIHASWVSSDRPQADEQRLARLLRNAVPAGADEAGEFAGDQLLTTCTEAGSKAPEG